MNAKNGLSRITVDMESQDQKKLKKAAIDMNKSMRQIVLQSIDMFIKNFEAQQNNKQEIIK